MSEPSINQKPILAWPCKPSLDLQICEDQPNYPKCPHCDRKTQIVVSDTKDTNRETHMLRRVHTCKSVNMNDHRWISITGGQQAANEDVKSTTERRTCLILTACSSVHTLCHNRTGRTACPIFYSRQHILPEVISFSMTQQNDSCCRFQSSASGEKHALWGCEIQNMVSLCSSAPQFVAFYCEFSGWTLRPVWEVSEQEATTNARWRHIWRHTHCERERQPRDFWLSCDGDEENHIWSTAPRSPKEN